jgi:hypothetical protein
MGKENKEGPMFRLKDGMSSGFSKLGYDPYVSGLEKSIEWFMARTGSEMSQTEV